MATIKDIAKQAGVSAGTVSKALNNSGGISLATQDRITKIARDLGYIPDVAARQMVTKRSNILGVLFSDSLDIGLGHQFFSLVLENFRNHANKLSYDVLIMPSHESDMHMNYSEFAKYRTLDGIFVCTHSEQDKNLAELLNSDLPLVTADVDNSQTPLVCSDDVRAAEEAYEYLYSLGHRDIVHLVGPTSTMSGTGRLKGFENSLRAIGLEINDQNHVHTENFTYEYGRSAMRELLKRRDGKLPDAVIAASDIVAIGAIAELQSRGYNVPEDVSVIGFDDIEMAKFVSPSLTSMAQDPKKIGEMLSEYLIERVKGHEVPLRNLIPMKLVERGSVSPRKIKNN